MKENQLSFTAMMTACIRAYHATHVIPKIFDDYLAVRIIPEEQQALIEQILPKEAMMQATNAISRARYTEDLLEKSVKQGVKQYIILGAGMDTFAFRRPEIVEQIQVFELDHPSTQEFKKNRIAELGWAQPEQLHFIPIDFTKDSLTKTLAHTSSYDPKVKSFFSWLGVTMYLTKEEVFAVLRAITGIAISGSMVVFDYFDHNEFISEKAESHIQKKQQMMQKLGEPMKTGFEPSTLSFDMSSLGLPIYENLSPSDIEERYFQGNTNGLHSRKNVHFACAVRRL